MSNFCTKCGNGVNDSKFCSKCGVEIIKKNEINSKICYLATIFFGIIGGLIIYFLIRKEFPIIARNCVIIGLVEFFIVLIIVFSNL